MLFLNFDIFKSGAKELVDRVIEESNIKRKFSSLFIYRIWSFIFICLDIYLFIYLPLREFNSRIFFFQIINSKEANRNERLSGSANTKGDDRPYHASF